MAISVFRSIRRIKLGIKKGDLETVKKNCRTKSIHLLIKLTSRPIYLQKEKSNVSIFEYARYHRKYDIAKWLLSTGLGPCIVMKHKTYLKYFDIDRVVQWRGLSFLCLSPPSNKWFHINSKWVKTSNAAICKTKSKRLHNVFTFLEIYLPTDVVNVVMSFDEDFLLYFNPLPRDTSSNANIFFEN